VPPARTARLPDPAAAGRPVVLREASRPRPVAPRQVPEAVGGGRASVLGSHPDAPTRERPVASTGPPGATTDGPVGPEAESIPARPDPPLQPGVAAPGGPGALRTVRGRLAGAAALLAGVALALGAFLPWLTVNANGGIAGGAAGVSYW